MQADWGRPAVATARIEHRLLSHGACRAIGASTKPTCYTLSVDMNSNGRNSPQVSTSRLRDWDKLSIQSLLLQTTAVCKLKFSAFPAPEILGSFAS